MTDAARDCVDTHVSEHNGFQPYWPTVGIQYLQPILEIICQAGTTCGVTAMKRSR